MPSASPEFGSPVRSLETRRDFLLATTSFGTSLMLAGAGRAASDGPGSEGVLGDITRQTFAQAEKLAGIAFTNAERDTMRETIGEQLALCRTRLEQVVLPNALAPATTFSALPPGMDLPALPERRSEPRLDEVDLPTRDEDIAFAPVITLSHWLRTRQITSRQLTDLYLERLQRFGGRLECVVTLTADLARAQAERADAELDAGMWRGPLHGVPWGAKDLLDTAGIATTWGATPFRDRVPDMDAVVVSHLDEAGAVLVAKLSLGALAYGDIWFGGRTRSPWNLEEGSSGSSAGSAAAVAAGLVGFALGTETYGSIVSPCMRCGCTGLRPTFGRVARTGAMALCWSLDKIGPITRSVEDAALVLEAIGGADAGDPASVDVHFQYAPDEVPVPDLRVGYHPSWFEGNAATVVDRRALDVLRRLGVRLVEIDLPERPYDVLLSILFAEAAAAFEDLTRSDRDDEMVWQDADAWPATFRRTWFLPAIEFVQAQRFRREVCGIMADVFSEVDVIAAPSFAANLLLITNNTGHPSLTLRAGFNGDDTPHGLTLIGNLFDENALCTVGAALQRELDVWRVRPGIGAE